MGPPLSGAPFHYHGPAFNALLHGRKLWQLLPPGDVLSCDKIRRDDSVCCSHFFIILVLINRAYYNANAACVCRTGLVFECSPHAVGVRIRGQHHYSITPALETALPLRPRATSVPLQCSPAGRRCALRSKHVVPSGTCTHTHA
jgi:hypothetical protein